ncbi:uncharacterized protein LOC129598299 [Paramacrobiotus metropolitanus]|uniref:uncharacterized protein LOC129598299 n=1 Tax=Paramacrobiotus metropolitanus TaxID=2943436 RepID=UPI002445A893|nr:uncharacterized protein LOC129598299 [Paramacrobiotus metropolitanus]
MPDCVAPGCDSGRAGCSKSLSRFLFPKDAERRAAWTRAVSRRNFSPSYASCLCEQHFEARYIIRTDILRKPDGTTLEYKRERPKLTKDAIPTIFPRNAAVLSETGNPVSVQKHLRRKTTKAPPATATANHCHGAQEREFTEAEMESDESRVENLHDLQRVLASDHVSRILSTRGWKQDCTDACVILYKVSRTPGYLFIDRQIRISEALEVSVIVNSSSSAASVRRFAAVPATLSSSSELLDLLRCVESLSSGNPTGAGAEEDVDSRLA